MGHIPKIKRPLPRKLSENEFFALFPLYRVASARSGDSWISRDDLLNGRNGIPVAPGMMIVWTLLTTSDDLREISNDEQSFRITLLGFDLVNQYYQRNNPTAEAKSCNQL